MMLEATLNKLNEIIEQQGKRLVGLEGENKAIKRRAESAESDWQLAEERIGELEAVVDLPDLAKDGFYAVGHELIKRALRIKELEAIISTIKKCLDRGENIEPGSIAHHEIRRALKGK